jgi:malate dehydrogenase (oxaloacetate-decarboxylating)
MLNKGSAFTQKERDELKLHGLVPHDVTTIQSQVKRRYDRFSKLTTAIEKSLFLADLQNTNEVLFYRFVFEHVREMLPLVYTPTVGDLSVQFTELHAQHRGLYLSLDLEDKFDEIFQNLKSDQIEVIVVTDGERILGLGDLGIGGIQIPIGKLSLYTLFGGVHPSKALPIVLDVGTNNKALKENPYYQGIKEDRVRGARYDQFIDKFIKALKKRFPKVLLQWEDFAKDNASRLLQTYRNELLSFNDDIQGTAAVALSAMITASQLQELALKDQRILIFGAGSAGLGIAEKIVFALTQEGMDKEKAYNHVSLVDKDGLILKTTKGVSKEQMLFAKDPFDGSHDLEKIIRHVKPTLLIGVSGVGGAFTKKHIETMCEFVKKPAIFPLSNPNICAEAKPDDILEWTKGQAIIATGSPFKNVTYQGKPVAVSQCNNVYIFPGVGLSAITFKFPKITDKMFLEASKMLSSLSPVLQKKSNDLFPSFEELRESSLKIAIRVAEVAIEEKLLSPKSLAEIEAKLKENMWMPDYSPVVGI